VVRSVSSSSHQMSYTFRIIVFGNINYYSTMFQKYILFNESNKYSKQTNFLSVIYVWYGITILSCFKDHQDLKTLHKFGSDKIDEHFNISTSGIQPLVSYANIHQRSKFINHYLYFKVCLCMYIVNIYI